ncbi:MAG TPA: TlpA disulfide reductase family protein [Acidobacteriaceae bacterium]
MLELSTPVKYIKGVGERVATALAARGVKLNWRDDRMWLVVFVAAAAVVSGMHWRFPRQAGGFTPAAERQSAGDLVLTQLDGSQWKLADHRGQVVLINYWATWCEPCREEMPGLAAIAREDATKGLAVVGIAMDEGSDAPSRVREFVSHMKVPYPVAFPAPRRELGPREIGLPTTILIDRQGRIVKIYRGAVERGDFAQDVAAALAES